MDVICVSSLKLLLLKAFFQKKTFYKENICVTNKNIYLFELYNYSAKKIFDHKKYICQNVVANSVIWSLKFWKHPIFGIS